MYQVADAEGVTDKLSRAAAVLTGKHGEGTVSVSLILVLDAQTTMGPFNGVVMTTKENPSSWAASPPLPDSCQQLLLWQDRTLKVGIANKRLAAAWDKNYLCRLIGLDPQPT